MRTTVTLEPDVARLLADHARRTRMSFKQTLNAAVRMGLKEKSDSAGVVEFIVEALPLGIRSGVDAGRFNSLLDELETDGFLEKATEKLPK